MNIRFFWKTKIDKLSDEFFVLERNCFSKRYAITPDTKSKFDNMFKCKSLIGEMRFKSRLIGMLFLDELIKEELYYLRVICISPEYRGRGLSDEFIRKALKKIRAKNVYLAFVSETDRLKKIATKVGGVLCNDLPKNIESEIWKYNPKLVNKIPGVYIEKYYRLVDETETKGLYSVFLFR